MAQAQSPLKPVEEKGLQLKPSQSQHPPTASPPNSLASNGTHNVSDEAQFLAHADGSNAEAQTPAPVQSTTPTWLILLLGLGVMYAIFYLGAWSNSKSAKPPLVGPFTSNAVSTSTPPVMVHVAGQVVHPGVYRLPYDARLIDAIGKAGGPLPNADMDALNLAAWVEDGTRIEVPAKAKVLATHAAPAQAPARIEAVPNAAPSPPQLPSITVAKSSPPRAKKITSSAKVATHSAIPHATTPSGKESKKIAPEYLAQHPININTATAAELQELPGIGPAMAEKIISYRQENGGFQAPDDLRNVKGIGDKKMEKLQPLVSVK